MVTQCSLLFMHKIFPFFAFIYIKRLLGALKKSRKTQKSGCTVHPLFPCGDLSVATNSCAKCHLCSWTSGCISSLVCKNQSLNQLQHQLGWSAGWGEEKNALVTFLLILDHSNGSTWQVHMHIHSAEAHLQKGFWGLLSCSRTLWYVKEPLKGTNIGDFEIGLVGLRK